MRHASFRSAAGCYGYSRYMVNRNYTVDERIQSVLNGLPGPTTLQWSAREMAVADRDQMPAWIERLREAEAAIRQMRAQLEGALSGRVCGYCGNKVGGRSDRKFCSNACRQMSHRASRLQASLLRRQPSSSLSSASRAMPLRSRPLEVRPSG